MSTLVTSPTQSGLESVLPFARLGRRGVLYAGVKGASLGELTSAGLPVSAGFVIGAPAHAAFCEAMHLEDADLPVRTGIEAISVSVDAIDGTRALVEAAEQRVLLDAARAVEPDGGMLSPRTLRAS